MDIIENPESISLRGSVISETIFTCSDIHTDPEALSESDSLNF